jgi:hypothetical protein
MSQTANSGDAEISLLFYDAIIKLDKIESMHFLSMLAVTIFARPECLLADKPAIRSTYFSIMPPKTLPFGLASDGNMIIVISAFDSFGRLPSLGGCWDNVIEHYYQRA